MSRRDYKALHAAADQLEAKTARAVLNAIERVRSRVSINELALALQAKDQKRALAVIRRGLAKDVFGPVGTIARDAVMKGGRIGAAQVRRS